MERPITPVPIQPIFVFPASAFTTLIMHSLIVTRSVLLFRFTVLGGVWQTKPDQEMNTLRNLPAITPWATKVFITKTSIFFHAQILEAIIARKDGKVLLV
jgi:hypothetical protein